MGSHIFNCRILASFSGFMLAIAGILMLGGPALAEDNLAGLVGGMPALYVLDILLVENVGNLVCPAEFEIGEHFKVALLSITEGEDKPLKYPIMFREADLILITKVDLLPHLNFDINELKSNIASTNPKADVIEISSITKSGFHLWQDWISKKILKFKNN